MSASIMQASAAFTSRVAGISSASRVGKRFAPLPVKPLRTRTVVKAAAKSEVRHRIASPRNSIPI